MSAKLGIESRYGDSTAERGLAGYCVGGAAAQVPPAVGVAAGMRGPF